MMSAGAACDGRDSCFLFRPKTTAVGTTIMAMIIRMMSKTIQHGIVQLRCFGCLRLPCSRLGEGCSADMCAAGGARPRRKRGNGCR